MFPISWNDIFRKKDGSLVNMEDAVSGGGGGGSIPPHSAADAGKVLGVTNDGTLAWITVSGGGSTFTKGQSDVPYSSVTVSAKEVI